MKGYFETPRLNESRFLFLCVLCDSTLSSFRSPSLRGHGQSMGKWTGRLTDGQGWWDDGQMERGASEVKAADKSETGSGSSSEVATAAPPRPMGQNKEEKVQY